MTWDNDRRVSLSARGDACPICGETMMKAFAFAELKALQRNGHFSEDDVLAACQGYCLGHFGEWHPDFIIYEERES